MEAISTKIVLVFACHELLYCEKTVEGLVSLFHKIMNDDSLGNHFILEIYYLSFFDLQS